jgi:hypothetical protein
VQVGGVVGQGQLVLRRRAGEAAVLLGAGGDVDGAEALGLGDGLLRPAAGVEIVRLARTAGVAPRSRFIGTIANWLDAPPCRNSTL